MVFREFVTFNSVEILNVWKFGFEFQTCGFGGLYFLWAKENIPFPWQLKLFPVPWLHH